MKKKKVGQNQQQMINIDELIDDMPEAVLRTPQVHTDAS